MRPHDHVAPHLPADAAAGSWTLTAALVVLPLTAYLVGVARWRSAGRGWPRRRTATFAAGVVLVAAATSPLGSAVGHADARGHMAQHLVLGMYAPLALVLAAPGTLLLGSAPVTTRRPLRALLGSVAVHRLTHPAVAAVLSVGGLYALYLTPLYALSLERPDVHVLVLVHFVLAGYLFAWSIAGPDPAPRRPRMRTRVAVLVLAAAGHAVLAKVLYARADRLPPGAGHLPGEVEQAAQWMYYGGDVAEILLATALFAAWYRRRGRRSGGEPPALRPPPGRRGRGRPRRTCRARRGRRPTRRTAPRRA